MDLKEENIPQTKEKRFDVEGNDFFGDEDDEDDNVFDDDEDEDTNDILSIIGSSQNIEDRSSASNDTISPFSNEKRSFTDSSGQSSLEFNVENVNNVLNEVRPYLISDGGNVSVQRIDEETRSVYLVLEGACGSCPSSTVTMKEGLERVLKENFTNLGSVVQVQDIENGKDPTSGSERGLVEAELYRISNAITAMGGVVELLDVDPIGVVELRFRGPNKIQKAVELAILDIAFVKHVKFVT